jgi:cbb3-type cytochrome oxidase subunit 3
MGRHIAQWFVGSPLSVIGMLIFLVAFTALVAWVYGRKDAKATYAEHGLLPFDDVEGGPQ